PPRGGGRAARGNRVNWCQVCCPTGVITPGGSPTDPAGPAMPDPDATPTHPSEDLLRAFSLGELDDDQLENISAHLNGCQVCCARTAHFPRRNAFLTRLQSVTRADDSTLEGEGLRRQAARALQREVLRRRSSTGSGWLAPSQPSDSAGGEGEAPTRG